MFCLSFPCIPSSMSCYCSKQRSVGGMQGKESLVLVTLVVWVVHDMAYFIVFLCPVSYLPCLAPSSRRVSVTGIQGKEVDFCVG